MIYLINTLVFAQIALTVWVHDTEEDEKGYPGTITHYFFWYGALAGANAWMLMSRLAFQL
jgi:hypothetical protein